MTFKTISIQICCCQIGILIRSKLNALICIILFDSNPFYTFTFVRTASQELETIKKQYVKIADAYGCLGVLQVNAGETSVQYLVMVTGCFSVGKLCDAEVFRITQTQLISLQFQSTAEEKISEVSRCSINFI